MLDPLMLDDADTVLEVTIKANGQAVTQSLDLGRVAAELQELGKKIGESSVAWLEAVCAYIESLGFPRPSFTTAQRFVTHVGRAVQALKKSDGASPKQGLPASTAQAS